MPGTYRIDLSRRLVLSRAWGVVTPREALALLRTLASDPDFRPSLDHLLDGTEIERFKASPVEVRAIADASPFGPKSRRAAVVSEDYVFGIARMYEVYAEENGGGFRVFRSLREARAWLGLNEEEE